MAWQTPKTELEIQPVDENGRYNGDWFNIADYNRITGNIEALHALAQELYPGFYIVSMPDQTVSDFPYASIINNIENNLDSIVNSTWKPPGYPEKKDLVRQRGYAYRRRPKPDRGHSINLIQYVSEAEGRPSKAII